MKKTVILSLIALIAATSVRAQVSQAEFDALKDIYEKLDGKNWTNRSGWDFSAGPEGVKAYNKETGEGWWGVTDVSKGHVGKLELVGNNLSGEFPTSVYAFAWARTVNLSKNKITGTLPEGIGALARVAGFDVSNNQLEGDLPADFTALGREAFSREQSEGKSGTDIRINLNNNAFTGTLPSGLGEMALLQKPSRSISVNVSNNRFSGELPASLLQVKGLTSLRASTNQLSGTVPAGLDELPKLEVLRLEKNAFTGSVPQKK